MRKIFDNNPESVDEVGEGKRLATITSLPRMRRETDDTEFNVIRSLGVNSIEIRKAFKVLLEELGEGYVYPGGIVAILTIDSVYFKCEFPWLNFYISLSDLGLGSMIPTYVGTPVITPLDEDGRFGVFVCRNSDAYWRVVKYRVRRYVSPKVTKEFNDGTGTETYRKAEFDFEITSIARTCPSDLEKKAYDYRSDYGDFTIVSYLVQNGIYIGQYIPRQLVVWYEPTNDSLKEDLQKEVFSFSKIKFHVVAFTDVQHRIYGHFPDESDQYIWFWCAYQWHYNEGSGWHLIYDPNEDDYEVVVKGGSGKDPPYFDEWPPGYDPIDWVQNESATQKAWLICRNTNWYESGFDYDFLYKAFSVVAVKNENGKGIKGYLKSVHRHTYREDEDPRQEIAEVYDLMHGNSKEEVWEDQYIWNVVAMRLNTIPNSWLNALMGGRELRCTLTDSFGVVSNGEFTQIDVNSDLGPMACVIQSNLYVPTDKVPNSVLISSPFIFGGDPFGRRELTSTILSYIPICIGSDTSLEEQGSDGLVMHGLKRGILLRKPLPTYLTNNPGRQVLPDPRGITAIPVRGKYPNQNVNFGIINIQFDERPYPVRAIF